jgi:hypothetical protein
MGFCAIPLVAELMAQIMSGMISPRYFSMYSVGLGLLLVSLVQRMAGGSIQAGYVAALVAVAVFGSETSRQVQLNATNLDNIQSSCVVLSDLLERPDYQHSRVMIGDADFAMQLSFYCPQNRDRIVFPADTDRSLRYLGNDSGHKGLLTLRGLFPLDMEPLDEFVHHQRYPLLALHTKGTTSFLKEYFRDESEFSGRLRTIDQGQDFILFRLDPAANYP